MASKLWQFLLICHIQINHILSECLKSPQAITHEIQNEGDIQWEEISFNTYAATFVFDVSTKIWNPSIDSILNAQITTRLFNDSFPSQTWRFKRGKQYQITIINNLGPESIHNPTGHNVPKDPNTTNIHLHGLHIGGENPGDSVFVRIDPGQQHTYYYNIPCTHSGGTHWWHPHIHGSVHLQVAGGAGGALIIDDDATAEGLPLWYVDMKELVFFITHIHLMKYTAMVNYTWDYVWKYDKADVGQPGNIDTFFVNGEFQPSVCMEAGEWIKFRFVQIETTEKSRIFYIGNGECQQYLLARDGVMVHGMNDTDMPRMVGHAIWLAHSSRADVAISCPGNWSGSTITYDIWTNNTDSNINPIGRQVIATIVVTGNMTTPQYTLTAFKPMRPNYLENLLDGYYSGNLETQTYPNPDNPGSTPLSYWKNMQLTGGSVAGRAFQDATSFLQYVEINRIQTWEVTNNGGNFVGVNLHPLHIHVNHFQLLSSQLSAEEPTDYDNWVDIPYGYQEVGDWLDTVWGPSWIRFKTDIWAGTVVLHCHVLIHEDQGAMGVIKITNGCDNQYNQYNITENGNSCSYVDSCGQFTASNPTTAPTMNPTTPTKVPSLSPISVQSTSPTNIPTSTPSNNPTVTVVGNSKTPVGGANSIFDCIFSSIMLVVICGLIN